MRAFPGCKVVRSHLSGEVPGMLPGKKALYPTGFLWCACLRPSSPHTQRLQRGVPWREPWVFWLPFGGSLGTAFFLANDRSSFPFPCLPLPTCPAAWLPAPDFWWCCLGSPTPSPDMVSDEEELLLGVSGTTCPAWLRGRGRVWLVPKDLILGACFCHVLGMGSIAPPLGAGSWVA